MKCEDSSLNILASQVLFTEYALSFSQLEDIAPQLFLVTITTIIVTNFMHIKLELCIFHLSTLNMKDNVNNTIHHITFE
jgi:hypothetical protein